MGAMATLVVAMIDLGWNMLTLRVKHGTHKLNRHELPVLAMRKKPDLTTWRFVRGFAAWPCLTKLNTNLR